MELCNSLAGVLGLNLTLFSMFFISFCEVQSLLFVLFLDYLYHKVLIGNNYRLAVYTDADLKHL